MSKIIESGQLWVVFDNDVYLKVKGVIGNTIYYNVVGSNIQNKKSYDDFIAYAIHADDVIGEYIHKSGRQYRISVRYDNTNNYLIRSDSKDFKMDLGGLYEYYDKE